MGSAEFLLTVTAALVLSKASSHPDRRGQSSRSGGGSRTFLGNAHLSRQQVKVLIIPSRRQSLPSLTQLSPSLQLPPPPFAQANALALSSDELGRDPESGLEAVLKGLKQSPCTQPVRVNVKVAWGPVTKQAMEDWRNQFEAEGFHVAFYDGEQELSL